MFTVGNLILGSIAALIVGLSKTAFPGAALVATPLIATIVTGRLIPGTTLPILFAGDIFAVIWYGHHTRWDLLRPMIIAVSFGFAAGAAFFAIVGSSTRPIDIVIGISILLIAVDAGLADGPPSMTQSHPPRRRRRSTAARAASPPLSPTLPARSSTPTSCGSGLGKDELVGTSAWFYFAVNVAKFPVYLALGKWSSGGPFITGKSPRLRRRAVPRRLDRPAQRPPVVAQAAREGIPDRRSGTLRRGRDQAAVAVASGYRTR